MKRPEKRETTEREDMMCTRCNTEGLEPHPAYADEYSGKVEIIKATRCSNEDCEYHNQGVPEEKIEMQMPDSDFMDIFSSMGSSSSLSTQDILTFGFVVVVLLFLGAQYGLIPFIGGGDEGDNGQSVELDLEISGDVSSDNYEDVNVQLHLNGTQIDNTDVNQTTGEYVFEIDEPGDYTVYASGDGISPPGETLSVDDEDEGTQTVSTIDMDLNSEVYNINQSVGQAEMLLEYQNPNNIDDITLDLSPIEGDEVVRTRELTQDRPETVVLPAFPAEQELSVNSPLTYERFTDDLTYEGQPLDYDIRGNGDARELQIELSDFDDVESSSRTVEILQSEVVTVDVASEETLGPATVTLKDGTSEQREQVTGTWEGSDNVTVMTGLESFGSGQLQIEPVTAESSETIDGVITGETIQHNFQGNQDVTDAVINFEGGDSESRLEGLVEMSLDAEDGSTGEVSETLTTIDGTQTYRLNWEKDEIRDEEFVDFWYEVGDERHDIHFDEDSTVLDTSEGDEVRIVGEAERETLADDEDSPHFGSNLDSSLEIESIEFSDENPDPEDIVGFDIIIQNNANSEINDELILYRNDEQRASIDINVPAGQDKLVTERDLGQQAVNEEGTYVFWLNDRGPYHLEVGDSEPTYGVGQIEAELRDVSAEGQVEMDTNGDGVFDCDESADGGQCEISTIPHGENTFEVEEDSVSSTDYTIDYTSKVNPRGIEVDIGEDGLIDFEQDGVLDEGRTETVELQPNESVISMSSRNDVPFDYTITWDSDAVIDNPVVDVGGEVIVSDEGTLVGPETYEIGVLEQGENEIRFDANSGGYTAVIEWNEQEGQSLPEAEINNQIVCEPGDFVDNNICTVSEAGISPGTHSIDFNRPPQERFDFQIDQEAKAVASSVNIDVDDSTETFNRPSPTAEEWDNIRSVNMFQIGENDVTVDAGDENGINPDVDVNLEYLLDTGTVDNLSIIVENPEGEETEVDIPSSAIDNGLLISDTQVTLPSDAFGVGENKIIFTSDEGIFELQSEIQVSDDTVDFRTVD